MNAIEIKKGIIKVSLDIVSYKENDIRIVYSPALDLSGYGKTADEAKRSFETTLKEYLLYCVDNATLDADLEKHGWKKQVSDYDYLSPDFGTMIRSNSNLRNLVKGNFNKVSRTLSVQLS